MPKQIRPAAVVLLILLISISIGGFSTPAPKTDSDYQELYAAINFKDIEKPDFDIFSRAIAGYQSLKESNKLSEKEVITIIDFRKSGNEKRL